MTQTRFDSFVVFAEMRTGSNFLEANLNALGGVECFGEAFNPHFIGYPKRTRILGVDQSTRDADPMILLSAIRDQVEGLGGFRYFHDHDARVLDTCLEDPRIAKIILTRNPVDSYVSWQIAQQTGQWKLTDVKARKGARAQFDLAEFSSYLNELQEFQVLLLNGLQRSGQTAFYVDYDDLQSVDVMNGLAAFLGVQGRLDKIDGTLKVQNPTSLSDKVANFEEMEGALAGIDRFNLTRTPNFEPRRGPAVPSYIAAADAPLLYVPIGGGAEPRVLNWLAAVDGKTVAALRRNMSQKLVRQWKRQHPGHRSFTILRHPVVRAHHAFCTHILSTHAKSYPKLRNTLRTRYNVPIPSGAPDDTWSVTAHRAAFLAFLEFLKGNLNGQTAIRVDSAWCTQAQALQGIAGFLTPDFVFREDDLVEELSFLLSRIGRDTHPNIDPPQLDTPFALEDIYDEAIERATRAAYQRDYMLFGFDRLRPL